MHPLKTALAILLCCAAAIAARAAGPADRAGLEPLAALLRSRPDIAERLPASIERIASGTDAGADASPDALLADDTAKLLLRARAAGVDATLLENTLDAHARSALARAPQVIDAARLAPDPKLAGPFAEKLRAIAAGLDLSAHGLSEIYAESGRTEVEPATGSPLPFDPHPAGATLSRLSSPAESIVPENASPALREVLGHFWSLSKFYRPSKGEAAVRGFVTDLAEKQGLNTQLDAIGNLLVRVPGTGRFARSKEAIALQSHLDMVLDADPDAVKAAGGLDAMFRDGVHLAASDGWIHSQDYLTTIGADNGIGAAMMMRYMTDRATEHPPLELVFTVDEETGMTGAKHLALPLTAKALLNLDNEEWGKVGIGSLGIAQAEAHYSAPMAAIPADFEHFEFSLTGLKGGHSGGEIHLGHGNAVLFLARMIDELHALAPEAVVVDGWAGLRGVTNKIPSALELSIAAPPGRDAAIRAWLDGFRSRLKRSLRRSGEADDLRLLVKPRSTGPESGLGFSHALELARLISKLPNGVIKKADGYPNRVEASSNVGFLWLQPEASSYRIELGVLPRSFTDKPLDRIADKSAALAATASWPAKIERERFPAWTPDPNSTLLKDFLAFGDRFGGFEAESVPGGLETAFFRQKFPQMELISIGPNIKRAHSREESVEIDSVSKTIDLLDAFLATL